MKSAIPLRDQSFDPMETVKLSICSITFNHGAYIRKCLDGFLEQVCDFRVEIIIHDDASTDGTADVLLEYAERYPSIIRPIFQQNNQFSKGVNPYYSYVFPSAKGEYIAICDGDDYWDDPQKLATQVAYLEKNPDVAITYGPVKAIVNEVVNEDYKNGLERDLSAAELKRGLPINTLTACFRNIFQDGPPVFLRSAPMGDMTVWAALGYHGRGKFLPDLKPSAYREHHGGIFSSQALESQLFMGTITLLNMAAYHHTKSDHAASRACLRRAIGQIVMTNGATATLSEALRKSISLWLKSLRRRQK